MPHTYMRTWPGRIGEKSCFSRASVLYIFKTLMSDFPFWSRSVVRLGLRRRAAPWVARNDHPTRSPKPIDAAYFDKMFVRRQYSIDEFRIRHLGQSLFPDRIHPQPRFFCSARTTYFKEIKSEFFTSQFCHRVGRLLHHRRIFYRASGGHTASFAQDQHGRNRLGAIPGKGARFPSLSWVAANCVIPHLLV